MIHRHNKGVSIQDRMSLNSSKKDTMFEMNNVNDYHVKKLVQISPIRKTLQ